jgi:hypothetical protein
VVVSAKARVQGARLFLKKQWTERYKHLCAACESWQMCQPGTHHSSANGAENCQKAFATEVPWRWIGRQGPTAWPPRSLNLTLLDSLFEDMLRRLFTSPPPKCLKISIKRFTFEMLVNQLACKCWPMFGMRMIIILTCAQSPMGLTLKSDKWQSKLRELFMLYKFHYHA